MNHSMGTVEKIVEVLNSMCAQKKAQASSRQQEHSSWLATEFNNIRQLLQSAEGTTSCEEVTSAASRQKRKSPETCSAGSSNSPLYKRNSSDININELLLAQNLPEDLTKLKKDQLLEELYARGCADMTMKALKKDLIEKLKSLVLDIHKRNIPSMADQLTSELSEEGNDTMKIEDITINEVTVPEMVTEESSVVDVPPAITEDVVSQDKEVDNSVDDIISQDINDVEISAETVKEEVAPSPRKQSILSEYRQHVNASGSVPSVRASLLALSQGMENETAEDRNARVQSEFEARKLRHRMSQINRTSDGNAILKREEDQTDDSVVTNDSKQKDAQEEDEELPLQTLMKSSNNPPDLTVDTMDTNSEEGDSNWSEVPSPKCSQSPENVASKNDLPPEPPLVEEDKHSADKSTTKPIQIPDKVSTKLAQNTIVLPTTKTVKATDSTAAQLKKPTNLVGGNQLSFLSSTKTSTNPTSSKPKTAVPALLKAARQKEKEEARAAQKKKEMEEKKKEHMRKMQKEKEGQTASSSIRSIFTGSKGTTAAPKEKGFGWTLGEKNKPEVNGEVDTKENNTDSSTKNVQSNSSNSILTEKKINPTDYRQVTPCKPVKEEHSTNPSSAVHTQSPPREEYKIADDDDGSDSGSGTDEEEDDKKKQIPDWAKGPKLREALEKQYGLNGHTAVDPDLIFPDVQTCSLEEIFGKKEGKCGKYSVRTSSAKWDEDEITLVEKRKYRTVMGYI